MSSKRTIFWRVYLSFFVMGVLGVAVLIQIVRIQTVNGDKWRSLADSLTTKFVEVEPNRGNIYASDGSLLATSLSIYDLHLDLQTEFLRSLNKSSVYDSLESLGSTLASYFPGENEKTKWEWSTYLKRAFDQKMRYLPIRDNVNHLELKALKKFPLFRQGRFKGGLIVEQRSVRKRPFKLLARRTIGYKRDNIQPVGLEGAYDQYLAGVKGKRLLQKVSSRDWIPINDKNELDPQNGLDIYTTIDINIQDFTEHALLRGLQKYKAEHGCALVMEVKTGKIVGIANLERDDKDETYWETYNYAIGESTQPGSTFKIAAVAALLEAGYMKPSDTVNTGDGTWKVYDRIMKDSYKEGKGVLTLRQCLEASSNVGIAKAMVRHFGDKQDQFIDFLKRMNLHQSLGVPLAGEPEPFIKAPGQTDWYGTTLAWMAHGYELKLTPLQTLTIYNAIANNGTPMRPLFVTEVKKLNDVIETFRPEPLATQVIGSKTCRLATEMLIGVIESDSGTARNIYTPGMALAGKTGTAVIGKDDEGKKTYQASFAGFFPADNPKYSCIVVVKNPVGPSYYGNDVAAPVFREIASHIYSYDVDLHEKEYRNTVRNIKKRPTFLTVHSKDAESVYKGLNLDLEEKNSPDYWVEPFLKGNKIALKSKEYGAGQMPDLRGLSLSDALFTCENLGLRVQYDGKGNVYRQVPAPGTDLHNRNVVYINLN